MRLGVIVPNPQGVHDSVAEDFVPDDAIGQQQHLDHTTGREATPKIRRGIVRGIALLPRLVAMTTPSHRCGRMLGRADIHRRVVLRRRNFMTPIERP